MAQNVRDTIPNVTFATVTTPLGAIDNTPVGTTFVIDVFENEGITYADFLQAFYTGAVPSETLKFFNPSFVGTNITEATKDKYKNILYLNSGGRGVSTDTNYLPKKVINDNGSRTEYIVSSYIIDTISKDSGRDYATWSTDSQLSLSKNLSKYNYFYDLTITNNSDIITNSLTKTELEKIINAAIYARSISPGSNYPTPVTGNQLQVSLNIGVIFQSIVGSSNPITSTTQFLYKILITDFTYSSQ